MEPNTIVLVHGFWVTPRSWEHWITHYEAKGYKVIAPGYPGFEVEVEALRESPQIIVDVTVPALIEKIEKVIADLDRPPIIMGHSAGGAFTQVLLDDGYGAAGVALNSAPTEGVRVVPLLQVKSTFPVLRSPANWRKAVGLTTSSRASRRPGLATSTTTAARRCWSPARRTTSCLRRFSSRTTNIPSRTS